MMYYETELKPFSKREQVAQWMTSLGLFEEHILLAYATIDKVGLEKWFDKFTDDLIEKQQSENPLICPLCHGALDIEVDNPENIFYDMDGVTGTLTCSNAIPLRRFFAVPAEVKPKPEPYTFCDFTAYWDLDVKPFGGYSYGISYEHNFQTIAEIILKEEDDDDEP